MGFIKVKLLSYPPSLLLTAHSFDDREGNKMGFFFFFFFFIDFSEWCTCAHALVV
jgi:hypothetical protein